jgi:polyphosphate kinase
MNNLSDERVIDALFAASQAGVRIDLIVRSICTLRPGVKGLSKNIAVKSILGRFLEHARVYYFENGGDDEEMYIGSADMMERNLDRRVEQLAAVKSPEIRDELKLMLDLALSDNTGSWTLDRRAKWNRVTVPESEMRLNLQAQLMRHSVTDA